MRNPKVLIAAGNGHRTEAEMIIGLHRRGIDIQAAFSPGSAQINRLVNAGVPTRELSLKSNLDLRNSLRIRRWIKDERFDVVHGLANRQVANFIWASYGLKNKVVAYRGAVGHISRYDPSCYLKWLNPRINKIICVSKAVENDLAENGVNREKLTTIYKGHKLEWYGDNNRSQPREIINSGYGIPSDITLVGMAANMRRVKGADTLLHALTKLPESVHGLFIGEVRDPLVYEIADSPTLRGRVHFTGFQPNASEILAGLDINIAPSRGREGLTKSVLEAMAQEVPCIVTNAGGLPEMITDGLDGLIVPKNDPSALADAITYLLSSPARAQKMGQNARKKVLTKFSITETIEQTANLYFEVTGLNN